MLLDKYLPKYTYKEYDEIHISSSKEHSYNAARNLDFSKSKLIKFLFTNRGAPTDDMTLEGFSNRVRLTFLEENKNRWPKADKRIWVLSLKAVNSQFEESTNGELADRFY